VLRQFFISKLLSHGCELCIKSAFLNTLKCAVFNSWLYMWNWDLYLLGFYTYHCYRAIGICLLSLINGFLFIDFIKELCSNSCESLLSSLNSELVTLWFSNSRQSLIYLLQKLKVTANLCMSARSILYNGKSF